ncbi:MAG TPA: hypothetical protein VHF47_04400 [Acidimicrobiales bacterium]|nr:hypothetical protein [Acidimicrobiales bacterium]
MDITCNLVGADVDAQLGAWRTLGPSLRRSTTTDAGLSLWFDAGVESELRAVAAKEADCCSFLRLDVVPDGDVVRLDITTELSDARPVIDALGELVGAVDR